MAIVGAMAVTWRQGLLFGLGLLAGLFAGAIALMAWKNTPEEQQPQGLHKALPPAVAQAPPCTFEPLLVAAGPQDGKFASTADLTDKTLTDVAAYASVGSDATTHGRVRDAEVAFITSCRIAGHLLGGAAPELAEAKYQLARHYAAVAGAMPAPSMDTTRTDVLQRAQTLFSESADVFAAKYGQAHEKTRLAAASLTLVQQTVALAGQLQQVAVVQAPDIAAAASAPAAQASSPVVAAATPAPRPKPRAEPKEEGSSASSDTSVMGAAPADPEPPKKKPRPKLKVEEWEQQPPASGAPTAASGSSHDGEAGMPLPRSPAEAQLP